jgi:hypothetical protein
MANNIESLLSEAGYIINNANQLSNLEYYYPTISEIQDVIS